MVVALFIGATEALKQVNELEERFDRERDELEERLREELFRILRIDPVKLESYRGSEEPPPINYFLAHVASLQVREALLLRTEHAGALGYNTYLPMKLFELVREDRKLAGEPLTEAMREAIAEHRGQIYALLDGDEDREDET